MIKSLFTSVVLVASAILSAETSAGNDAGAVRRLSAGPGGCCTALAIHPKDPRIMMAGLDMGYVFRTENGGKSWTVIGDNGQVNPGYRGCFALAFAGSDPDIVWAASEHGAYKSTDCGKSFRWMTSALGGDGKRWNNVVIDPADADRVYLLQGELPHQTPSRWSSGCVYFTKNGGLAWTQLVPVPAAPGNGFADLAIDPRSPVDRRRLMISGFSGLFVSRDNGVSWTDIAGNVGLPKGMRPKFGSLDAVSTPGGVRVFLTVRPDILPDGSIHGGVFVSDDFGKTWRCSNGDLPLKEHAGPIGAKNGFIVRSSPKDPDRCYLGVQRSSRIYRSDDGGKSWRPVSFPDTVYKRIDNPDGTSVTFLINSGKGNYRRSLVSRVDGVMRLAVCSSDPDSVAYSDNCGVTASSDGGGNWEDIMYDYTYAFDPGRFGKDIRPVRYTHALKSRGVHLLCSSGLHRDPHDPRVLYAGIFDHGIMISRDGGENWESPTRGLRTFAETGWGWCHAVTVDRQIPGRVYATFGTNRVYRSDDFGRTWHETGPADAVTVKRKDKMADRGVVIDYDSPPDRRTLYLCADHGLWKSADGGKNWKKLTRGLPAGPVTSLEKIGRELYAGSMRDRDSDGRPCPRHGLYRSTDGGTSWHPVAPEKLGKRIFCIAWCRDYPENIYVVTKEGSGYWGRGTIWRSRDAGQHWEAVASGREYRFVAVNPHDPDWIYTHCTSRDLLKDQPAWFRSTDGGKTWHVISGAVAMSGRLYNLLIDSVDPRRVYFHEPYAVCEYFDAEAPTAATKTGAARSGSASAEKK